MITGINKSKSLIKQISYQCKCKFDGRKCDSNQKWNKNKHRSEFKNLNEHYVCVKNYIWNPTKWTCENGKYLGSIIVDSVVTCGEIIEATKTVLTKSIPKKINEKR